MNRLVLQTNVIKYGNLKNKYFLSQVWNKFQKTIHVNSVAKLKKNLKNRY